MKRLLFIAHRLPFPPDKGERVRAYRQLKALAGHFRITLAALLHGRAGTAEAAEGLGPFCQELLLAPGGGAAGRLRSGLALLTGRSATEGYFRSRRLGRAIRRAAAGREFDVAVGTCSSMLEALLTAPARSRVMDLIDVDSAKWAGYADAVGASRRWLYRLEGRRVARLERRAVTRCDAVALVSAAEADALADAEAGVADGAGGAGVLAVGNGVDLDYFTPPAEAAGEAGPSVVFTGTMDYRPNAEGVCRFVRDVWPGVRAGRPEATFAIVGRSPTRAVRALAAVPGVRVTGAVPDVRPFLSAAAVAVAPLQIARGLQNKVLEAMAMARPVVATPAALEGLDVRIGRDVLAAEMPEAWRAALTDLLADPGRRDALGQRARRCVETHYTWAARLAPLVDLCRRLADRP